MSNILITPASSEVTGRILVVDDTTTNLHALSELLTRSGYEVCQVQDSAAALKLASAHQPSLILLDIMMPGMDGYEVCARLRAMPETAHIPIIFLSALDSPLDKVLAFKHGAADYVTKPFQPEEVLARVHHQIQLQAVQRQQQRLNAALERRVQERTHQLELAHHQLLVVAMSDRLTQLPNRLAFVKQLGQVMAQAQIEPDQHFAVLFLDCDRFKRVNDSLGHRVGDQLLREIASRLTHIQQHHLTVAAVARFGGDEFALLLTPVPNKQAVALVADKVLASLATPFAIAERKIFMSASLGIVWGEAHYAAAEHLLRDADVAMYRAKDCSHSQCLWFEPAMHNRAVHLLQLETDLRLALERQEFEIYYQPIVDLFRLRIVGFEALVRWRHPTRGLVFPDHFIGFAEESGLIVPLGEQVLEMTCADIARWERSGAIGPEITVSVNMAASQLLQPDIVAQICHCIKQAGVAPHRLHLELTERSIINNHVFVDEVLRALQQHNIRLSIDDFGTGYSALSYLHTLPVNCLKIDRSFVQPIAARPDSLGIVPLIINIAKTMNMQVIAEGIETIVQLRQLQQLGCEYGQGYLFEKAVPADVAIALLNRPAIDWMSEMSA